VDDWAEFKTLSHETTRINMTYNVICDECGFDLEFADSAGAYGAARDHEATHVSHTVRVDRPA
jgi:hypothetical protein